MSSDSFKGSPPQVRGKHLEMAQGNALTGITPAGAGKTVLRLPLQYPQRDHPRRCGENSTYTDSKAKQAGSPPQVRGKLFGFSFPFDAFRITPAGAGKTATANRTAQCAEDHPRRCGENFLGFPSLLMLLGSPPQVRGKRAIVPVPRLMGRITPAGAGKTYKHTLFTVEARDHPRRCGEN